nr:DUF5979 domain-containing protein [Saccharofermentans sp.]
MIAKKSKKRLFGLVSTALAASILMQWLIIPKIQWNSNVFADGDPLPSHMDAASAYNYSRVLSYGSDYGIITNSLNKHSHMETTYAAKVFDGSDNSDIDFITNPAHFMVGQLTEGSELAFGRNYLTDGSGYCSEFIIEAPQSVLDTIRYMEGFREDDTTVHRVVRTQQQIDNSIDALMANARTYANTFNTRAGSSSYVFPSACVFNDTTPTTNSYIHLTQGNMFINLTDDYADKVVYINVDSTMLLAIAKNNGVQITKPDSTVVVFNFPDNVALEGEARQHAFDCDIFINQITVNGVKSKTAANGGSAENPFTDVDSVVCRTIIWNVPGSQSICLGDMGGVLNAPNSAVQSREGSTNGWIIADTMDLYVEHHFIFQDTSAASMGDFSFYIVKALTRQYGRNEDYTGDPTRPVVQPDTSISLRPGQFAFIWQEYTDDTYSTTVGSSTTAPIGSLSSAPANAYFPHITFFSDEGHLTDDHYVAPGTTESFYFRVTEDHSSAGIEGISESDGYVDIRLDVTAHNNGTYTYEVDYTFWTGEGNDLFIYNAETVDNVMGTEFRIGSFYNRVANDVEYGSLVINKRITIDGAEYSGTNHPLTGINQQFSFTVSRVIDGVTYYYNAAGDRFLDPQVITTTNMDYYYGGAGNVTIPSIPVGTYTITEVVDSNVGEITTAGETYYLDATNYDVAGSSTQFVNVSANGQSNITITNDYTTTEQFTGSLVITKQITLPAGGSLSDLGNIVFNISPVINGISTLTLDPDNIAGTGWTYDDATGIFSYTFDYLPQGTEYTVTETSDGTNSTNNYEVVVVTPAPVTIPVDGTQDTSVTVAVTNTYSESTLGTGSLTVTKVVGGDTGYSTTMTFPVTVTLTLPAGADYSGVTVTGGTR